MRQAIATAIVSLHRVLASRDVRRAELAWVTGWTAEWAWQVALFVHAFAVGGVVAVGALGLVRTLPAAVLAPMLSGLTDRLPRHRVLLTVHAGRATLIGLAVVSILAGWPPAVIFVVAALDGLLAVLHRPTHMSLMPALARGPEELVAANLASSTLEAAGTLVGPMVAGVLVAVANAPITFAVPAAAFAAAAAIVAGVEPTRQLARPSQTASGLRMLAGGLGVLGRYPHAALLLGLFGLQTVTRGLLSVLIVVTAVDLLAIGEEGVGYLNAGLGAGGLVGALLAMGLVGRGRMATPVYVGLVMWGVPILVMGVLPALGVALLAMAAVGAANAVLDVAGFTLLQRSVPNAVRGSVFGTLEAIAMLGVGVGAALAPLLVTTLGPQAALVGSGLLLPVAATLAWRWLRLTDAHAVIPEPELALLRGVPMFEPLPLTILEQLAEDLVAVRFEAGEAIIREGDVGDRFYILRAGQATVEADGSELRRLDAGDSFGEIALLRDVPRTATVTAVTGLDACALTRDAFLAAVTGDRRSMAAAEDTVRERLAASS
ncbi:MAG TPA: MFS transporter [Candidatus Limnocylindria bacterium]|nr:MFS transporter [Candidatus Limnocylindria bacterium]